MFSATMLPEVERIAKQYLRHPVIIKIGDQDSGKNKRIEQIVFMINEGQKKNKLNEDIRNMKSTDKVCVDLVCVYVLLRQHELNVQLSTLLGVCDADVMLPLVRV